MTQLGKLFDVPMLIARVAAAPETHIGRKSVALLSAYLMGYSEACDALHVPLPHDPLDGDRFYDWIARQMEFTAEHKSRLNAFACVSPYSYATLIGRDDSEAFDHLLRLRSQAIQEIGKVPTPPVARVTEFTPSKTAFEFITLVRARPAMYLGNGWSIADVWALLNGYLWCELDHAIGDSETRRVLSGFQSWMEDRYPFGRGLTWDRIIHFLSLAGSDRAFESFELHLEMYRRGVPSNEPDPIQQEMLRNIIRHAAAGKVGGDSRLSRDE